MAQKKIKATCIACGYHREVAYRDENGPICTRCADTIEGKQAPEK